MAKVELHGRAKAAFVAGTVLLLVSYIWSLAHASAQRQWG